MTLGSQYILPFEDERWEDMKRMSQTPLDMNREFALAMNQGINHGHNPDNLTDKSDMRFNLLVEEMAEVDKAYHFEGKEALLKELADLIYVTYGFAVYAGWDLDEAVRRVHASNMSKLGEDGKPIYRDDGKVLKGPRYAPPDLKDLV